VSAQPFILFEAMKLGMTAAPASVLIDCRSADHGVRLAGAARDRSFPKGVPLDPEFPQLSTRWLIS
jgi:hypothetical protein